MAEFLRFSSQAIEPIGRFDDEARMAERQRQKLVRVTDFMARHNLIGKMHDGHGRRLALLDIPHSADVEPTVLDKYLAQRIAAERTDIFNNCFQVAREAHAAGAATGILYGEETEPLARWSNHRINYDVLPDSTLITVDYTSRENMLDRNDPQFDVLALRVANKEELIPQVAELYGGDWVEVHPKDY